MSQGLKDLLLGMGVMSCVKKRNQGALERLLSRDSKAVPRSGI
jgi:hypothetical protein